MPNVNRFERRRERCGEIRLDGRRIRIALLWRLPQEALDDALQRLRRRRLAGGERPEIRSVVEHVPARLLRRHVREGARRRARPGETRVTDLREAEVEQPC